MDSAMAVSRLAATSALLGPPEKASRQISLDMRDLPSVGHSAGGPLGMDWVLSKVHSPDIIISLEEHIQKF